jgi:hypothetical protein
MRCFPDEKKIFFLNILLATPFPPLYRFLIRKASLKHKKMSNITPEAGILYNIIPSYY